MKKTAIILLCCTILCALHLHAQSTETPTHLVICDYNDNKVSILLSETPKITFPDSENKKYLQITTTKSTYDFYTNDLNLICFSKLDISGTEAINATHNTIKRQGDMLCFSTDKPDTRISIIDVKGYIIMSQIIDSGNYYYSLSDLIPGTYIAKINDTTIKFIKR